MSRELLTVKRLKNVIVGDLQFAKVSVRRGGHPNVLRFSGVLVRLDEPSTKPPGGAEGHKIMVPTDVAKRRLQTLIGMGLNYDPDLDKHHQRRKVGTISKAWIDGKDLWVEGTIWKHDFPEAVTDLKKPGLGMSMEIGQVQVADANQDIWQLSDFYFLGATILKKDSAAYYQTQAAIAAAAAKRREQKMAATKRKAAIAASDQNAQANKKPALTEEQIAAIAKTAVSDQFQEFKSAQDEQTNVLAQLAASLETINASITSRTPPVAAAGEDDDDDEEEFIHASRKKKGDDEEDDEDEDEDDMEGSGVDTSGLEDLGDDEDENDEDEGGTEVGRLNKDAKNKGSKTTVTDRIGKHIASARERARINAQLLQLKQENAQLLKQNKRMLSAMKDLKHTNQALKDQSEMAAAGVSRRSVALPQDLKGLLNRSGVDVAEMQASGAKISVDEFDGMLTAAGIRDSTARMTLKNKMHRAGMMDDGIVDRGLFQRN